MLAFIQSLVPERHKYSTSNQTMANKLEVCSTLTTLAADLTPLSGSLHRKTGLC
jgi:hypothetical protein